MPIEVRLLEGRQQGALALLSSLSAPLICDGAERAEPTGPENEESNPIARSGAVLRSLAGPDGARVGSGRSPQVWKARSLS